MPDEPRPTQAIPWTQSDIVALRTFLAANPRFLRKLQAGKPKRPASMGNEERANYGSQVIGRDDILDEILAMASDPSQGDTDTNFIDDSSET